MLIKACVQQKTTFILSITLEKNICSYKCLRILFFPKKSLSCARTSYLLHADIFREVGMTPFFAGYFCIWQKLQVSTSSFPTIKSRKNLGGN